MNSKHAMCSLSRHDVAVSALLLVKGTDQAAKWCHTNDDETGDNAVHYFEVLPSERAPLGEKLTVKPPAISQRKVQVEHSKAMNARLHQNI